MTARSKTFNVLHITTQPHWRGGENQIFHLLKGTPREDFTSSILIPARNNYRDRFAPFAQVYESPMANDLDVRGIFKIIRIVRECDIHLIHAHSARAHSLGLVALVILKIFFRRSTLKLIVHRRVEHLNHDGLSARWKYKSANIDAYVAISSAVRHGLIASGIEKEKVHYIASSADAFDLSHRTAMRQQYREQQMIPSDTFVFAFVGALEEAKGIFELAAAWRLMQKDPSFETRRTMLLLAGKTKDSQETEIKLEFEQAIQWGQVRMLGFTDKVRELLCAADCLVLPTHFEGLGSILLDGALSGCALVASRVGGVPDIVIHQKTGLLVEVGNAKDLAAKLLEILTVDKLRASLTAEAEIHVLKNFSVSAMVQKTLALYRKLLTNKSIT